MSLPQEFCLQWVPVAHLVWYKLPILVKAHSSQPLLQRDPGSWLMGCERKWHLSLFSCSVMSDSCDHWTVTHQAPLSMGFPRWEHWSGLPFPSLEDLPNPGIEPMSPALTGGFFTTESPGKPEVIGCLIKLASADHCSSSHLLVEWRRLWEPRRISSQMCPFQVSRSHSFSVTGKA